MRFSTIDLTPRNRFASRSDRFIEQWEVWRHVTMVATFLGLNNLSWQRWPFALSNNGRKVWATVFLFLSEQFCSFFSFSCHICRATVCWDPEILRQWQREVTASHSIVHASYDWKKVTILQKRWGERGSNSSGLQRTLDTREKIYYHQANLDNFLFRYT